MAELGYLMRRQSWDIVSIVQRERNEVGEFITALPLQARKKIVRMLELIADADDGPFTLRNKDKMRHLGNDLFELKSDQVRLLFFVDRPRRTVVTNGFLKKTRRTPRREIDAAVRAREIYFKEMR